MTAYNQRGAKEDMLAEYLRRQANVPSTRLSDTILSEDDAIYVHNDCRVAAGALTTVTTQPNEIQERELDAFKSQVRAWIQIDTEIKDYTAKMRMLDRERKSRRRILEELSKHIMSYMHNNSIDALNSQQGVIKHHKSYVKTAMPKKTLLERLRSEFATVNDVESRLNRAFNERERIEKHRLTRT
jgi:hypothetical protein